MIKNTKPLLFVLAILIFSIVFPYSSIKAVTIDSDNEYNLPVGDYPGDVSNTVYAKFKKAKKDFEDYTLNLYEDDEEVFVNAAKNSGITVDDYTLATGFTTELIYLDPDSGDEIIKKENVTVLCPIPDDAQEHYEDCKFYSVSSGKLKLISPQIVKDDDDVIYQQFDLPTYGMYGFVYHTEEYYEERDDDDNENNDDNDDNDYDNDDDDNQEETIVKRNDEPIEPEDDDRFDYTDDELDDDEFEYSDEDFDLDADDDSDIPDGYDSDAEDGEDDDDDEPYYYDEDDENYNDDSGSSTSTGDDYSRVLDNTGSTEYSYSTTERSSSSYSGAVPKTGDDFPLEATVGAGIVSLAILTITIVLLKKKK